ncbi:MmgE/PrpD family protein [Zwartia panacis]|uniref:MmgE/PrpD family protein n=1 Tax=Zwartia panacis TaxID=2683345 RepID=UPI0025B5B705|nr:MmgE/PrpD family protein [Zwartia panacis]MDN4017489.1 MmgE/PrpD family protein [Zwartia panacis]
MMRAPNKSASEKIASFVMSFDPSVISPSLRHVAARAIYDTLICAVAGAREPASVIALKYAQGHTSPRMATAWATGDRLSVEMAALVNGTTGHALDFDDVSSPLRGHPTVAMIPALLALGESIGAQGREIINAYVVGFEVTLRLARAMVDDHYAKGWHSTASIASFGATAACAYLLKLSHDQIVNALGVTVSQIAGTRQNFGTMSKPLQAGQANAIALRAVSLAELGFDASADAMDGKQGYTALYADGIDIHLQLDSLGQLPLELERSGLEIKKYPLCYATHRTIDGLLDILKEYPLMLEDIESVEITTNFRATVPLIYQHPQTGLEGKFSMQYAVTAALLDGEVLLSSFEDQAVQRPSVQAFLSKVKVTEGPPPMFPRWAKIRVLLGNGQIIERRVESLRGSTEHPLSDDALIEKGVDCLSYGGQTNCARDLANSCFAMDHLPVSALIAALTGRENANYASGSVNTFLEAGRASILAYQAST